MESKQCEIEQEIQDDDETVRAGSSIKTASEEN